MSMESSIKQMIREPGNYLTDKGFEWGQNEGQLASELIEHDIKRFIAKPPKDFMGLGWMRASSKKIEWVGISEEFLILHTLVTGTTGSGKTTYFKLLILQATLKKQPLILIDLKNDEELAKRVKFCLKLINRLSKYNYVSLAHPKKSARISLVTNYTQAGKVANRITSAIQRTDSTSDPFASLGIMSLTTVVGLVKVCEIKPTFRNVKSRLSADISLLAPLLILTITKFGHKTLGESDFDIILQAKIERCSSKIEDPKEVAETYAGIYRNDTKGSRGKDDTPVKTGIDMFGHQREHFQKMALDVMSTFSQLIQDFMSELLSPDSSGEDELNDMCPVFNTQDIVAAGDMLYLGLNSLTDAKAGSAVGSISLSDITSVNSMAYNFLKPDGQDLISAVILVDKAAEIINNQIIRMLNRARGAGLRLFISSQSIFGFEARLGSEAKMKQVATNTNHFAALRMPDLGAQKAIMKYVPPTKFEYITCDHGSSVGADPKQIIGNVGERLMKEEDELFRSQLLGWLPNLEFMAINQADKIVKDKVPIILIPKNDPELISTRKLVKKLLSICE